MTGTVYSETIIWVAPANFAGEVPYQLAIADLDNGERQTVRVAGDRVAVGDPIEQREVRNGVPVFRRITT